MIDLDGIKWIFGLLLIVLSVFFAFFSGRISIRSDFMTMFLCSALSGVMGGFFGIGGPLLVLYFLSTAQDTKEYIGCLNFIFAVSEIYNACKRVHAGIITMDLLPFILAGTLCILAGRIIGTRLSEKINGESIKKIIYVMLALSGIITFIQSIAS